MTPTMILTSAFRSIWVVALCVLFSCVVAHAQPTLDPVSGTLRYSVPISSMSVNNVPVNVSVAWLDNVQQVAIKHDSYKYWENPATQTTVVNAWESYNRRHGIWAVTVNGFVVGSFSRPFMGESQFTSATDDSVLQWLTIGLDVSNSMRRLENSRQDVIKLLRADGSVMELRNPIMRGQESSEGELFTGTYYVHGMSNTSFAKVAFDTSTWFPSYYDDAVGERDTMLSREACLPRVLRYYPGDGTEYVFREIIYPYGIPGNTTHSNATHNGMGPRVWYLEELNRDGRVVTRFRRSKHMPTETDIDKTPGRAHMTEWHGHRITYANDAVTVEAEGRTTVFEVADQQELADRDDPNGPLKPLENYERIARWADGGHRDFAYEVAETISFLTGSARNMVRGIRAPGVPPQRLLYENRLRQLGTLGIHGVRLTDVIDSSGSTHMTYWNHAYNDYNLNDWILSVAGKHPLIKIENVIKNVEQRGPNGSPRTRVWFDTLWNTVLTLDTGSTGRIVTYVDLTQADTLRSRTTRYMKWVDLAPVVTETGDPEELEITHLYEVLRKTEVGDVTTWTTTTEDSLPGESRLARYPMSQTTTVRDGVSSPTYTLGTTRWHYTTTQVSADLPTSDLRAAYARRPQRVATARVAPQATTELLDSTIVDYVHLGLADLTCTVADTLLDEWSSRRKLDSVMTSATLALYAPVYETTSSASTTRRLGPVFDLATFVEHRDALGQIDGGSSTAWHVTNHCDSLRLHQRGTPAFATSYGETPGTLSSAPQRWTVIDYTAGQYRQVPYEVRGYYGESASLNYKYTPLAAISPTLLRNDGTTQSASLRRYDYLHDAPRATNVQVRYANASGSISSRGLISGSTTTPDGRMAVSFGPDAHASAMRAHVDSLRATAWAPGDVDPAWLFRQPYVKLWKNHTRRWTSEGDTVLIGDRLQSYDGVFAEQPQFVYGTTEMSYVAHANDVLHRNATTVDRGHLRMVVTNVTSYGSVGSFPVTVRFSGGGLSSAVDVDYVFDIEHMMEPDLLDTFAVWTVDLPSAVLTAMKAMSTGQVMDIDIITQDDGHSAYLEIASHAEDAAPRLEFFDDAAQHPIVGTLADETVADITSHVRADVTDRTTKAVGKLDAPSQWHSQATYQHTDGTWLSGRYVGGASRTLRDTTASSGAYRRGNAFSGPLVWTDTTFAHAGGGAKLHRDLLGRETKAFASQMGWDSVVYADGTVTKSWDTLAPPLLLGVSDTAGYYRLCYKSHLRDETGRTRTVFRNALGAVMESVVDSGGLEIRTKHKYDVRGRLWKTIDPSGVETTYAYDAWGRVVRVDHPDLGTTRMKFDDRGLVRFVQEASRAGSIETEQPASVRFQNYDDLGRLTVVGEAAIDDLNFAALDSSKINVRTVHVHPTVNVTASYTINNFLVLPWVDTLTRRTPDNDCAMPPRGLLWMPSEDFDDEAFDEPVIVRPAQVTSYDPQARFATQATATTFEDLQMWPMNGRVGMAYDTLPVAGGKHFWEHFPSDVVWDAMTPTGTVRNLKGRLAAVAYRDHGQAPYNFRVHSYDERGRLEAMLRMTDGLGFDGVYYHYDAADNITIVQVIDPLRQYLTWYSRDSLGRVDSVHSWVTPVDSAYGFWNAPTTGQAFPVYKPVPTRPADIPWAAYAYDTLGRITSRVVRLPDPTVDEITTSWSRDLRDRLRVQHVVDETPSIVHDDSLTRDAAGRITRRATVDHLGNDRVHDYTYDAAGRLTDHDVDLNGGTERQDDFTLDDLTRRTQDDANGAVAGYTYPAGPPQANMPTTVAPLGASPRPAQTTVANADGEMSTRALATFLPAVGSDEVFHYGYAHRVLRMDVTWDGMPTVNCQVNPSAVPATFSDEWQWQYNYSPTGERETKRLMRTPRHDSSNCGAVLPRVHYLLDAADRQMVVYHGRQTANLTYCNPTQTVRRVFLYPMEYRMYGPDGVAVVWERDQNAQLVPRAVSTDAQGSERYVHGTGMALSRDYRAFGVELGLMQPQRRTGWIGKERDHETSPLFPAHKLMDLSARRYDPMTALFTSVDELWASFPQQHGYHYAYHDPVNFSDPSGRDPLANPLKPNPRPYRHVSRANDRDFMTFVIAHRMRENAEPAGIMDNQLFRDYAVQERQSQEVLPKISRCADVSQPLVDRHYDPDASVESGIVIYEDGGQVQAKYAPPLNPRRLNYDPDESIRELRRAQEGPVNILAVHHFHLLINEAAGILPPGLHDALYAAFAYERGFNLGFTVFTRVGSQTFAITIVDVGAAEAFVCAFTGMREDVFPNYSEVYTDEYGDFLMNMLAAINTANTGILVHWRPDDQTPFELVK